METALTIAQKIRLFWSILAARRGDNGSLVTDFHASEAVRKHLAEAMRQGRSSAIISELCALYTATLNWRVIGCWERDTLLAVLPRLSWRGRLSNP